jgi:hypothetical protein
VQEVKQFADFVSVLGRVTHLGLLVDDVAISPTLPFPCHGPRFDQIRQDPLRRPLGDPDLFGDVSQPDVRVTGDAKQYLSVVGKKPPVAPCLST